MSARSTPTLSGWEDQAAVGIIWVDTQGRLVRANPAAARLLGLEPDADLAGRPEAALWHPEEHAALAAQRDALLSGLTRTERSERRLLLRSGASAWVDVSSSLLPGPDGAPSGIVRVLLDIEPRKRAEEEQSRAREGAEHAARERNAFLAMMSHEIRTPMNSIIGFSDSLSRTSLDERQARYCEQVRQAGQRLLSILNDLLDYAKLEAGRLRLEPAPFRPAEVAKEALGAFEDAAKRKGLSLSLEAPAVCSGRIRADPVRFRQILSNLVSNAVKFTETGSVSVQLQCEHGAVSQPVLCVSVRDTGIGIPAEALPKLFEPFMQIDNARTRRFEGTGLGLAICHRLAEAMGGVIAVESESGKGSTFHFRLPVERIVAQELSETSSPATAPDAGSGPHRTEGLSVLVVDDDELSRLLAREFLVELRCSPTLAACGSEALLAAKRQLFDLLLLDQHLPDMRGTELLQRIRTEPGIPGAPVAYAVTAGVSREATSALLAGGFAEVLSKPLDILSLRRALSRLQRPTVGAATASGGAA